MEEKYSRIIAKIKETSIRIAGREVSKAYIDYYTCFEGEMGRFVKEKDMIIIDKFFVDYGTEDFIETLITHECCHLRVIGHGEEFQILFAKFKENTHWDVERHPDFSTIKNRLFLNDVTDEKGNWNKREVPINREVKEYVRSQMAIQDRTFFN